MNRARETDAGASRAERLATISGELIAARRGLRGVAGRLIRAASPDPLARDCRLLTGSGLFWRDFYWVQARPTTSTKVEPVIDFLLRGAFIGLRPNPLFDSRYYLDTNADVRESGENPLVHYLTTGEREGRWPNLSFDPAAYRAAHPELASDVSALAHHLLSGSALIGPVDSGRLKGMTRVLARLAPRARTDRVVTFVPDAEAERISSAPVERRGLFVLGEAHSGRCDIPPAPPADPAATIAALGIAPRLSLVCCLETVDALHLARTVESLRAQWHEDWELVLVDQRVGADPEPIDLLPDLLPDLPPDPRIVRIAAVPGRAAGFNAGVAQASGSHVMCLDAGDELTADCLFELAARVAGEGADLVYGDEDVFAEGGGLRDPFFKPDWSPDTLMALPYLGRGVAMRRARVLEAGGFSDAYGAAAEWDLALRVTEGAVRVAHVPHVLYHRRGGALSKDMPGHDAGEAGVRLREAALRRRGLVGRLEPVAGGAGAARVVYGLSGTPRISLIIPSKNNGVVLRQCVTSVRTRSSYADVELVLLDNGSTDPDTLDYLATIGAEPGVRVVPHDHPFNFSELCNVGARAASGALLVFLNDDTEVLTADWLERMAGLAQLPHVGAVGAKLLYPGGERVQHVGVVNAIGGPGHAFLGIERAKPGYYGRALLDYDWLAVTGACLMMEREKFDRVGGFDERFPVAFNDVDLCYRVVKAGLYNVMCASAELLHHESLSRGNDHLSPEKTLRLKADMFRLDQAHPEFFMRDPFSNPNLLPYDVHMRVGH